jgi:hypothetical protein
MTKGMLLGSTCYRTELYVYEGPDSQCSGCLKWGHIRECCPTPKLFHCNFCAESHPSAHHCYTLEGCSPLAGSTCEHFYLKQKYANCYALHFSNDRKCPHHIATLALAHNAHSMMEPEPPRAPSQPAPTILAQPAPEPPGPADHAMSNTAPVPSSTPALS